MPGVDDTVDPLPPEPFSGWWLAGGIVLAVVAALLVAWPWISRWLRSRRPAGPPEPAPPAEPVADGAGAARALAEIDRIESAWRGGELSDRTAAQAIAQVVREFTGQEAAVLTLLDLRRRGDLPSLTTLIEAAYPVEFGVKGEGDIGELAVRARQAVGP